MTTLRYASLVVSDVTASAAFYEQALGLVPGRTGSPSTFRALTSLGLSWPGVTDLLGIDAATRSFLTFDPGSVAAVEERTARLVAQGAQLVSEPQATAYGTWQSVLLDPDGHVVRLDHDRD